MSGDKPCVFLKGQGYIGTKVFDLKTCLPKNCKL